LKCFTCGKIFYRYKGDIKWSKSRGQKLTFCSRECYYRYLEKPKAVKKDQLQALRRSRRMKRWRIKVFKRDHYICQMCGKKGGRLNAHHIKRFIDYPDLRFDTLNGITLCESCHKKTFFREKKFEKRFLKIAKENYEKEKNLKNGRRKR